MAEAPTTEASVCQHCGGSGVEGDRSPAKKRPRLEAPPPPSGARRGRAAEVLSLRPVAAKVFQALCGGSGLGPVQLLSSQLRSAYHPSRWRTRLSLQSTPSLSCVLFDGELVGQGLGLRSLHLGGVVNGEEGEDGVLLTAARLKAPNLRLDVEIKRNSGICRCEVASVSQKVRRLYLGPGMPLTLLPSLPPPLTVLVLRPTHGNWPRDMEHRLLVALPRLTNLRRFSPAAGLSFVKAPGAEAFLLRDDPERVGVEDLYTFGVRVARNPGFLPPDRIGVFLPGLRVCPSPFRNLRHSYHHLPELHLVKGLPMPTGKLVADPPSGWKLPCMPRALEMRGRLERSRTWLAEQRFLPSLQLSSLTLHVAGSSRLRASPGPAFELKLPARLRSLRLCLVSLRSAEPLRRLSAGPEVPVPLVAEPWPAGLERLRVEGDGFALLAGMDWARLPRLETLEWSCQAVGRRRRPVVSVEGRLAKPGFGEFDFAKHLEGEKERLMKLL